MLEILPELVALVFLPLIIFSISLAIRKRRGQPSTAGLDIFLVIASIDFMIVIKPEPWIRFVHLEFAESFRPIYISLGLICILLFILFLNVEDSILRHSSKIYIEENRYSLPVNMRDGSYPLLGVIGSWFFAILTFGSTFAPLVL